MFLAQYLISNLSDGKSRFLLNITEKVIQLGNSVETESSKQLNESFENKREIIVFGYY